MGDVSSAIPNDLILYGGNAESHNRQLRDWARSVSQALDALRRSKPDPGLLPSVPDLGASLDAYAVKKEAIDKFVYDVGMAFLEVSTSTDLNALTSVSDSALNGQLDKDLGAPGRQYAQDVASGKMPLDQALAMIGDDPIETAAFFQALGPAGTLQVLNGIVDDPGTLAKFDDALATATQSPTWDPKFNDQLANGNPYDFEPMPEERRWYLTAQLFKSGIYSSDFLTKVGDAFLFHQRDDGVNHGAQLALAALGRNPDVALDYLNGTDPSDKNRTRLNHILENGVSLTAMMPGGESEFQKYEAQIKDQLGLTTLAANGAPDATPDKLATLLASISKVPVSVVPQGYRDVVTQLIGLDIGLMGDKVPDPAHPELSKDSPLSWEERQRLFLIAAYDVDPQTHQLVPNQARIDALRESMLTWAMDNRPNGTDPTVWLHTAASMNALLTDAVAASPLYQEELAKQQEEFNAFFAGVLFSVALPAGAAGLGALGIEGLTEGTIAAIEAGTHIAISIGEKSLQDHPPPAWAVSDDIVNQDLLAGRTSMVVMTYQQDPNASWIPDNLRGKPPTDPAVANYLASVAVANDTSDLPDEYKHGGTDVPAAGNVITQLNAYSGLFKQHDPHQAQEMMN
jgi:hypothetical protein